VPIAACGGKAVFDADGAGGSSTTATNTTTSTASTSTSISTGTVSTFSCEELAADYAEQLAIAKTCSPLVNTDQCTELVEEYAGCSCPVYVNPTNSTALTAMIGIKNQYQALGCDDGLPCPSCAMPQGGGCSDLGVCQTYGQD